MNKYIWISISALASVGAYFLIKKILDAEVDKCGNGDLCSENLDETYEEAKEDLNNALEDFENRIKESTYDLQPEFQSEDEFLGKQKLVIDGGLIKGKIHQDSIYSNDEDDEPEDFVPAINPTWKKGKEKLYYFAIVKDSIKIYDHNEDVDTWLFNNVGDKVYHFREVDVNDRKEVLSFMEFASTLNNITTKSLLTLYRAWGITELDWECYEQITYNGKKRKKTIKKIFGNQ